MVQEIKTIKLEDKNYPALLKKIFNPPKILHIRGEILRNEKYFAIVGTRRCSEYGEDIAFSIARDLSKAGLTIVSGMAKGIDTAAHKGALDANGRTMAILGTGIDEQTIYPRENLKLSQKILENKGCLISEYPAETRGTKFTFPERNRIISGLSLGVLVVEANFGSGALITANYAKEQNKKVFAVPGSIHFISSRGCHNLIKKGAKLVENANDILKKLSLPYKEIFAKEIKDASPEQNLIINALKQKNLHIDEITENTGLSPQMVSATLSLMKIEDKIKNLGGNVYTLIH